MSQAPYETRFVVVAIYGEQRCIGFLKLAHGIVVIFYVIYMDIMGFGGGTSAQRDSLLMLALGDIP